MENELLCCDCHVHMVLDGVYWKDAIGRHREQTDEAFVRKTLKIYQEMGYRYLRDGGDAWGVCLRAKELAGEYGLRYRTPAFPIHRKGHYGGFIGRGYETIGEYRQLVKEAKSLGADFIKVMISGLMDFEHYGVLTDEPMPGEEIRTVVEIAHEEDLPIMVHANGTQAVSAALSAGVDSVEHGAYLDAETLTQLAESQAVWVPTLITIGALVGEGRFPNQVVKPLLHRQMESVGIAAGLGAKIAVGSDAGAYQVYHGFGGRQELELLRKAIGPQADQVLLKGNQAIMERF